MNRRRLSGVAATLAWALLIPASRAAAEPVAPDDFFAALSRAIDQSAVFERGTTLTYRSLEYSESLATPEPIVRLQVVNPDGSLSYRRTTLDSVKDVRCPVLDQCWQRITAKRGDHAWHALPAGALYYTSSTSGLFDRLGANDPAAPGWEISDGREGSRVFTFTYAAGSSTGEMRWIVQRRHLTMTWSVVSGSGQRDVLASESYMATPNHTRISRPTPATIGAPVPKETSDLTVEVLINR